MKKILAAAAAILATITFAAPAQAAAPANLDDVKYALIIGKMAWVELPYSNRSDICDMWDEFPKMTRNMMAEVMRDNLDSYISVYDSKRAAYRLLKWGC